MSYDKLQRMHNAIEIIEAERALNLLNVYSYPHLKRAGQTKLINELRRLTKAKKQTYKEPPPKTMREMYERMMRALRG